MKLLGKRKPEPHKRLYYVLIVAAWLLYLVLSMSAPMTTNTSVHISRLVLVLLGATIIVPYLLTWLLAVLGWYHFNQFVRSAQLKHLHHVSAFRWVSRGLGLLIVDLIGVPILNAVRGLYPVTEITIMKPLTILSNYFHVAVPLIAFGFLFYGSRKLLRHNHYAQSIHSKVLPTFVSVLLLVVLFCLSAFTNPSRQTSSNPAVIATYYLPDVLIALTIILPLAITWALGLMTALNTERYVHSLADPRWRRAIISYFHGLLAIVSSAIILQGVTAIGNQQLQQISLVLTFAIVYLFIFIQAWGYIVIRTSARHLRQLVEAGNP